MPTWRTGNRFVLMQGGVLKSNFTVTRADQEGYELTIDNGMHMRRDLDLGILGEWPKQGDVPQHALHPFRERAIDQQRVDARLIGPRIAHLAARHGERFDLT